MRPRHHRSAQPKARKLPPLSQPALRYSVQLVLHICRISGTHTLIEDNRSAGAPITLGQAIERLDTPALFNWLVDALSYQGISDRVAYDYIAKHGSVTWAEIEYRLSKRPSCPKLKSYWHFHGCGYEKTSRSCSHPEYLARCPLPKHRLRNGRLNQTAYSLFFFLRDIADSDLVNWIDGQLSFAMLSGEANRIPAMREALLGPLRHIHGVADKVLGMTFSMILLAAQDARTHWHETGGSMIAIDTLVHKFLHRTGIIAKFKAKHPYGPRCYDKNGCADIIEKISSRIDAREFNKTFPRSFPRFVQFAIWRYCAQEGLDICNSNRIDDRKRCQVRWCRLFGRCARHPISPPTKPKFKSRLIQGPLRGPSA
jgi:hypothetical protein